MKTLRFIGMALFAVLMCVNFASCSSSDDDPTEEPEKEEVVTQGKKLVEMIFENNSFSVVYKFSYHNDGKLSQIKTEHMDEGGVYLSENFYYNWIDDQIKISADGFYYTCSLTNGVITEIKETDSSGNTDKNGSTHTFTYNNSKELTNYKSVANDDSEIRYEYTGIWNNGNMTEFKSIAGLGESHTVTYGDIKNKGWWYPSCDYIGMDYYMERAAYLFLSNPSLLGKTCSNLPKRIDDGEYPENFIFDIDKEGYVETCKIVGDGGSTTIYTYKWE